MNTQLSGSVIGLLTPMEKRIANCEAILAEFVMLDSLRNSESEATRKLLLLNSANLAYTVGQC